MIKKKINFSKRVKRFILALTGGILITLLFGIAISVGHQRNGMGQYNYEQDSQINRGSYWQTRDDDTRGGWFYINYADSDDKNDIKSMKKRLDIGESDWVDIQTSDNNSYQGYCFYKRGKLQFFPKK